MPQNRMAKHLRRLRTPKRLSRFRTHHALVCPDALQRIGHRHRQQAAYGIIDQLVLQTKRRGAVEAWAHRIVHNHPVIRIRGLERG